MGLTHQTIDATRTLVDYLFEHVSAEITSLKALDKLGRSGVISKVNWVFRGGNLDENMTWFTFTKDSGGLFMSTLAISGNDFTILEN